jgi:hypothetical protein
MGRGDHRLPAHCHPEVGGILFGLHPDRKWDSILRDLTVSLSFVGKRICMTIRRNMVRADKLVEAFGVIEIADAFIAQNELPELFERDRFGKSL